jgi:hypothetical protein
VKGAWKPWRPLAGLIAGWTIGLLVALVIVLAAQPGDTLAAVVGAIIPNMLAAAAGAVPVMRMRSLLTKPRR